MDPVVWHRVAAISGMAAIALGAYGSHAFKPNNPSFKQMDAKFALLVTTRRLSKRQWQVFSFHVFWVWNTANLYHLVHTAALLATPLTKNPNIFGGLLTIGILAFSGTCYMVALLEDRKYATLAPFGGLAFIVAWGSLVL